MAYDSARDRVVLFGGYDANTLTSDTWEWDGTDWALRNPATIPTPRVGHAMTYDSARGRVVLFGGNDANMTLTSDTWEWDGTNWTLRKPAANPSARSGHAMAYDIGRQRVVLFGGGYLGDTWEWDGRSWTQRNPAASPPSRAAHAMAYDASRQRVVLFGGNGLSRRYGDTWEWDGVNWEQRNPAASPPTRLSHALVYDVGRQRVVLFGGMGDYPFTFGDTWEWDGQDWSQGVFSTSPAGRFNHAMAYESKRGEVICFGGMSNSSLPFLGDTWEYGPPIAATYVPFGIGCPGTAGTPSLAAAAGQLPWIGKDFTLSFSAVPQGRPIFVFLGFSRTSWMGQFGLPLDLTGIGMPGCTLYASGEVVGLTASVGNNATWTLPLCNCPNLLGVSIYNQGFVLDPTANAFGVT